MEEQAVRYIGGPLGGLVGLVEQISPPREKGDPRHSDAVMTARRSLVFSSESEGVGGHSNGVAIISGPEPEDGKEEFFDIGKEKVSSKTRYIEFFGHEAYKKCNFCIQNGEEYKFAHSHNLREKGPGGRNQLTCPVLRNHVCEWCGATGDFAHTRSRCPVVIERNGGVKPLLLAKRLNQGTHTACGRRKVIAVND